MIAVGNLRSRKKQQPDCKHRVHREVDRVDKRRERDVLLAHDLVPEFVGRVACDEEEQATAEEPPGYWSLRLAVPYAVGNRHDCRQPQKCPRGDLARPLHPGKPTENQRLLRRNPERRIGKRENSLEGEEPPPGVGRHGLSTG